jgi:hypothetical protein
MDIRDFDPVIVIHTWISEISTSDSNKHMDIRDIDLVIVINKWISEISTQ